MTSMDVDLDVPSFLHEQQQKAPPNLQHYFATFGDLYEKKLWHQLTLQILELYNEPDSEELRIPIFQQFVAAWKDKMNTLSFVTIALKVATQFQDKQESVDFLNDIIEKVDKDVSREVHVHAVMEAAHFRLQLNQMDEVKKAIEESEKVLERLDSVETVVYGSFYRVSTEYYRKKGDYVKFYKTALLYLACIDIDHLSAAEREERAYHLSLAALLGDTIYNFGELLMHPILDALSGRNEWLRTLLFAFNKGDIGKYETLVPYFDKEPLLKANSNTLRQKICLMSLIETVFTRPGDNRSLTFGEVATKTALPVNEVENLVMRALSLKLIRGSIDQVDQLVTVTWVQPRVLERNQIDEMKKRLEAWNDKVKSIKDFVKEESGEITSEPSTEQDSEPKK